MKRSVKQFKRADIEPYPADKMRPNDVTGTLCAVLRDIHAQADDEEIKLLARIATTMAKKMSKKLYCYYCEARQEKEAR